MPSIKGIVRHAILREPANLGSKRIADEYYLCLEVRKEDYKALGIKNPMIAKPIGPGRDGLISMYMSRPSLGDEIEVVDHNGNTFQRVIYPSSLVTAEFDIVPSTDEYKQRSIEFILNKVIVHSLRREGSTASHRYKRTLTTTNVDRPAEKKDRSARPLKNPRRRKQ